MLRDGDVRLKPRNDPLNILSLKDWVSDFSRIVSISQQTHCRSLHYDDCNVGVGVEVLNLILNTGQVSLVVR